MATQTPRKRYALIGTGGRASFYYTSIANDFQETSELVAFLDTNQTRMNYANEVLRSLKHEPLPTYLPSSFAQMVEDTKPDELIITTIDRTHAQYIALAHSYGLNVITEKPMTVDVPSIHEILKSVNKTGKRLRVTFNYRYAPHNTKIYQLLSSGAIGKVHAIHFEWMLNSSHGADYFRRWHRDRYNSGGLLVHKSTHHFDLVNYWLQSRPDTVFAMGDLKFYGKANAERRGVSRFYDRSHGQLDANAKDDPFALDLSSNATLKSMYLEAEHEDGYYRDQSVFSDGISIEDTMSVMVRYRSGSVMTYSLTAYSPLEGFRVSFTGDKGRLDVEVVERSYINAGGLQSMEGALEKQSIILRPMFGEAQNIDISSGEGGHGGGDPVLLRSLFGNEDGEDEFKRSASHIDGALSILTGIAANKSIGSVVVNATLIQTNVKQAASHSQYIMPRPSRAAAPRTSSSAATSKTTTARPSSGRPASSIANSSDMDSDDDITVAAATSTSTRIAQGVALPRLSAMERAEFKKPPPKSCKSPTHSSMSSIDANTSRDSSIEYETPGTTPAISVRAGPSTSKRKRSTLGKVVGIEDSEDDEDNDFLLATKLQEEEYAKEGAQQPPKKRTKLAIDDWEDDLSMLTDAESLSSLDSMPLVAKSKLPAKKKTQVKADTKKTPTRTASSTARSSIGKSLKKPILDDSDESDLEKASIAETEDSFVVSDSEEAVSTIDGVSDTESDVPLAITSRPKTVTAASRPASRARGRGSAARGRRHGRFTAVAARAVAEEIEDMVNADLLSRKDKERKKLEKSHPQLRTMWKDLEQIQIIKPVQAAQPTSISRRLKPFQLEGLDWMMKQEQTQYKGGLLGDEMGMGKTIQAVSLIMSDYPQKEPTLVLVPPVALMQWEAEITEYTDGKLNVLVYHGSNTKCKKMKVKDLKKFDVIMMSYNSLESMHRKQLKGHGRGEDIVRADSPIHAIHFHRIILDEAHSIKSRQTGVANACFALKGTYKWCLSGTPVQNRVGEFFSLLRFLEVRPFTDYFCKECPCSIMQWEKDKNHNCVKCKCRMMSHVSVFNQELLNPLTAADSPAVRKAAMAKLHMITARIMLRRMKRDHTASMELPPKEVIIHNEFFGEIERDFSSSIMSNTTRQFDTYVAKGVMLNNYANIFGLIMQMRQVSNHPDLLLKRHAQEGQNVLVCNICDEVAEDAVRSQCKHDFCRACVKSYVQSVADDGGDADCPRCHIALAIDFDQPEINQDEDVVKKSSIINRIKMEDWTSSTKIEMLIYDLYKLRSKKQTLKSIVFSQFTSMLQLIEWRLRRAGFNTVMLDGSMTPTQRQKSIDHFMNTPDCEIFLVSLKAGGVALNLTEASRVFIVDPWWNPAAEWQSADRCHRIGQRRPCVITRLVIEDSVESRIVMLQEKKANMINSTINNDQGAMEKLTPEDMQFLFRGN
ncbi:hypothetical protein AC578_9027 [Pseudocercospora eumusae]|uniref:Uncharacterized protein n=1 Tax=Pseudocercospora eumusae TaxID=321146 RepID=A0A139GUK0_9PEZI|nr:hypothetical protein AC578_9027 [Pseudocercospora eumusae]